jgi:Protein of unknown function (DUF1553)/Protein of unknown function (DUF1549)/Bacterial Ig-like domain (group 2)
MKTRRIRKSGMFCVWTGLTLFCCSLPIIAGESKPSIEPVSSAKPNVVSIRLVPEATTLHGTKSAQHFLVLGKDPNGLERDLTLNSQFSLSNAGIVTLDGAGTITTLSDGLAILTASFGGRVARATIHVEGSQVENPFSFPRDIAGIFTRRGCNGSNCHGGVKGRGGFKLSLDALHPMEDYKWIVEGGGFQVLSPEPTAPKIPRINLKDPEKSLLLLKPTFSIPHGGGQRFPVHSPDYETLLKWIRSGAPYGDDKSWQVKQVEVFPDKVFLDKTGKQQLLVTAVLSDGTKRDITAEVSYASNNGSVAEVSAAGLITGVGTGETAVIVRAAGHEVSANIGVIARELSNYPPVARRNYIDELVYSKLQKLNVIPSPQSTDAEFLRRVCLDLTGTLPPANRVREFLASRDPRKRDKLIEVLLNSPEYVDYWTFRLSDVFRVESAASSNASLYQQWLRDSIDQNKPYDRLARERVAAQGYDGPATHYTGGVLRPPQAMMSEEARVFLGVRLDCAQCHNHPREAWSQDQFWGMAAFFGHVSKIDPDAPGKNPVVIEDPNGYGVFGEGAKMIHPRSKKEVEPAFLDGSAVPQSSRGDLRMTLAEWMTSPKNPFFAQAAVNRFWGYFFTRGIVDPVDDFRSSNPPTDPDLLQALSKDFADHGYDLKHLFRVIVQSNTYQESGLTNDTNKEDKISYSHALPRPLDAEVLLDAIIQLAGTNRDLRTTRTITWTDDGGSQFLKVYGRPDRTTVPERDTKPNLSQALDQLAGETYTSLLSKEGGTLERVLHDGASNAQIIEELYLSSLSRYPTAEEQTELQKLIQRGSTRREGLENLMWALMNSEGFVHNY